MRYFMFFMLSLLALNVSSYASDCKIIEKDGSTEVVCVGNEEDKVVLNQEEKRIEQLNKEKLEKQKIEIKESIDRLKLKVAEAEKQIQEQKQKEHIENTVKVSSLNVIVISRSPYYVTYSIKANVENVGPEGRISVKVIARNGSGYELDKVILRGVFAANTSHALTTTHMVQTNIANRISEWQAYEFQKH